MNSKISNMLVKGVTCGFAAITILSPVTAFAASSSGKTSGSVTNTINTSPCTGTQQVSGNDAVVFGNITPDNAGTIACSKSDGFKTTISGADGVNNYHWTAWYKEKLKDDIDHTLMNGNYSGFSKDKVNTWKEYEKEIRELNDGNFPSYKDYFYPTDTSEGKLDFWGDKAGYYSILGDPRYQSIHLESYQQFSYRVERTENYYSIWTDPSYVPPSSGNSDSGSKPGKPSKPKPVKPEKPKEDGCKGKKCDDELPKKPWETCGQFLCSGNKNPDNPDYGIPGFKPAGTDPSNTTNSKGKSSANGWKGGSNFGTSTSKQTYYLGSGRYQTITTLVHSFNETKQVKVADASVANNAYATEIAAYGLLNLVPGANTTKSYAVGNNGFWKTTPSYWTDGGSYTIKNNGGYYYGYVDASENNNGVNKVNLYKYISQKDKLYDIIHGYKKIPEEICKGKCYPTGEDETPLANIVIEIDKDEPQNETELKKFVHLDKNPNER